MRFTLLVIPTGKKGLRGSRINRMTKIDCNEGLILEYSILELDR